MSNGIYIDRNLMRQCDKLGIAFKISATQYNYDSEHFVKTVMTSKKLDWVFADDECQEWCDGYFLMSVFDYHEKFKVGKCADEYLLWWLGYLYKYWMTTRGTPRREIYKILPFKRFVATFDFYHTQGWDYVIDDAIRVYNEKSYRV